MESSVKLGKIAGIEIGIHYTWLIVFGLITWSLAVGFFPQNFPGMDMLTYWLLGAISAILLFVSVLVHELSHSLVAISRGMPVESITLFIFGGVSNIKEEAHSPTDEFWMAFVGPLSSLVMGGICFAVLIFAPPLPLEAMAVLAYLAIINVMLGVFNLIPGFPLDGGRVFRSILWWMTGNLRKATRIAAATGQVIAYLFIFGGLFLAFTGDFLSGIWIIFIGWFLNNAAESSYRQTAMEENLKGVKVAEVMINEPCTVSPDTKLDELVHGYMLKRNVRALPVVEGNELVGLVTLSDVKAIPSDRWHEVPVSQVMSQRSKLVTLNPQDDMGKAVHALAEEDLNQVPVIEEGKLVGLVNRSNVIRFLQVREELGARI